jgi:hypothetical protein
MITPVRGIAALDRLAEQLAGDAQVRLGVAATPAELIAVHRMRYRDASARGQASAEGARDGLESDQFDTRALQICAWDGERLVGTLRLVLPMLGKRLPIEDAFGLTVEPAGEAVDVGQPLVALELGEQRGRRAAHGLLAQAWFETRARGYLVMAGTASSVLIARYEALGLKLEILASARDDRHAVRLAPVDQL